MDDQQLTANEYEQHIALYESEFKAFRHNYQLVHPPPRKPAPLAVPKLPAPPQANRDDYLTQIGLVVMLIASLIVSASHTIPTFMALVLPTDRELTQLESALGGLVAIAGFVMVEISLFTFAYVLTRAAFANSGAAHSIERLVKIGLALTVSLAVAANVRHVLIGMGFAAPGMPFWDAMSLAISVLIGIAAPGMAWITGDIFASLNVRALMKRDAQMEAHRQEASAIMEQAEIRNTLREEQYNQAVFAYEAEIAKRWEKSKKPVSVERPHVSAQQPRLSARTADRRADSGQRTADSGHKSGQADKTEIAYQFLLSNPELVNLSYRDLAAAITDSGTAVGKQVAENAKKRYMSSADSSRTARGQTEQGDE